MSSEPKLLSEVGFGAFLAYSPRGTSEVSRRSRLIRDQVKHNPKQFFEGGGLTRLLEALPDSPLEGMFCAATVLVPMPRRAPIREKQSRWPGREIAEALVEGGLGSEVQVLLERTEAVPKSAFASPGERPSAKRHFGTFGVEPTTTSPQRIVIVDDVITKGSTLLGAASRLREAFPTAEIEGFAVVRTMGLQPEIESIVDPVRGVVQLRGDSGWREP